MYVDLHSVFCRLPPPPPTYNSLHILPLVDLGVISSLLATSNNSWICYCLGYTVCTNHRPLLSPPAASQTRPPTSPIPPLLGSDVYPTVWQVLACRPGCGRLLIEAQWPGRGGGEGAGRNRGKGREGTEGTDGQTGGTVDRNGEETRGTWFKDDVTPTYIFVTFLFTQIDRFKL